ncbi:hypothetical protein BDV39DRAFT_176500 [Aspergillus sergii]|uniref:Uncharacterized protein n=1 Tax=Aspergillus sergii TaxID=1034303 RepID=A0A5N6X0K9_9EURO|nr:hypothetical protein BDV39DRAFT_176500 [Aspergillus sergii]
MGNSWRSHCSVKEVGPIQESGMHPVLSSLGISCTSGTQSYTNRGLAPSGPHVQPLSGNLNSIHSQALPT